MPEVVEVSAEVSPVFDGIRRLEAVMLSMPDQIELETIHTFGPGFYARTIKIPAGVTLVGKLHKTEHVFLLTKGELAVVTEDGGHVLSAPAQFVARPGLKRAGHAITDCEVTNVHITAETDLAKLEADLIQPLPALEVH